MKQEMNIPIYDTAHRPPPAVEEMLQLLRYRDLVYQLVSRNIKARYKRSVLGIAWTMLNPLAMMVVLTVVFFGLFHLTLPNYSVYLLAGLLLWNFFSQATISAISENVWGGSLLRRIYVPKAVFTVAAVCTSLINLMLALVPLILIGVLLGVPPNLAWLALPVPILLTTALALGVGLIVSVLAVYFADVVEIYQLLLMAWMYMTPIIYPIDIIPTDMRWLFFLNPMFHLVEAFRAPIYQAALPAPDNLAAGLLMSVGILVLGWWVFTRAADEIVKRA